MIVMIFLNLKKQKNKMKENMMRSWVAKQIQHMILIMSVYLNCQGSTLSFAIYLHIPLT